MLASHARINLIELCEELFLLVDWNSYTVVLEVKEDLLALITRDMFVSRFRVTRNS